MMLLHNPIRKTFKFSIAAILFALPGLILSLPLVFGRHSISPMEAKYLTTIALPDCFDPAGFPHTWVALLLILPIFSWVYTRWNRDDAQLRQLLSFEFALVLFFVFGIIARLKGRFDWVELFPMRVYAVFALLLFFWQLMDVLLRVFRHQSTPRVVRAFAFLLVLCMPSPVLQLRDMIATHVTKYLHPMHSVELSPKGEDADFIQAAKWVSDPKNTGAADIVIAPPWRNDGFYYIDRPLIANWHAPRYDRMTEWQDRIESLVGDTAHLTYEDALQGEMDLRCWSRYASLSTADIAAIQRKYPNGQAHAKWLITTARYPYPLAFSANSYLVYQLP